MHRRTAALSIIATLLLAGCTDAGPDKYELERFVRSSLKDPDSGQFRGLKYFRNGDRHVLCGEVNARNSFGGMVGFTDFYAWKNTSRTMGNVVIAPPESSDRSKRISFLENMLHFCQDAPPPPR
jgi:hypothetical protein